MNWLYDEIFTHRGLYNNKDVPENSLKAFQLAVENGLNIECDLHLLTDNEIAIIHDSNLKRMCGIDAKIEDYSSKEIKELQLLDTDCKIPLLSELLELVNGKVGLLLELKNKNIFSHKLEKEVLKQMQNYRGNYVYESFNPESVRFLKSKTTVQCGQLASFSKTGGNAISGKLFVCYHSKPDFIAYNIDNSENNKHLKKWHNKLPLIFWTIKNKNDITNAKHQNAENIIFDTLTVEEAKQFKN